MADHIQNTRKSKSWNTFLQHVKPKELTDFLETNESVSRSGDLSKGQGYDFLLEEDNKDIKQWIWGGAVSNPLWLAVCRNKEKLDELKKKFQEETLCYKETDPSVRKLDIEAAINDRRLFLRDTEYFDR